MTERRSQLKEQLVREFSRGPVDAWLKQRAEWMIAEAKIPTYLGAKIVHDGYGTIEKSVNVLSIGSGKGHELDEMDSLLPGATIIGLDPHDFMSPPMEKRINTLAHDTKYLPSSVHGENLAGIEDRTQDGVTLFFVLHHTTLEQQKKILDECKRVLKDDGYLFIAEDLISTLQEQRDAERIDRVLNTELTEGPHNYHDTETWKNIFTSHGFDLIEHHERASEKVRHGFFILKRTPYTPQTA